MRWLSALLCACMLVLVSGCASVPPAAPGAAPAAASIDPFERWNRKVFAFNEAIDEAVLKPVAQVYRDVVPQLVRTGVGNFFGNIGDVWSTVNHLLQGKLQSGVEMGMRVLTNTFIGIGGVLDPASEMKLVKRPEDMGQTLGVWGIAPGPYLVLPIFGPSTVRDGAGLPFDMYASSTSRFIEEGGYLLTATQLVNTRAEFLSTTKLLGEVSLDKYSFVRDAYLSRRLDQVYDGAPPMEKFDDDPGDSPAASPAASPAPKR
jgi:phospholipid-binding lipoprotein MlaA